jgi:hypothetical protein
VLVATVLWSGSARGYDPADATPAGDPGALVAGTELDHSHWLEGAERSFLAATFDVGFIYVRPTLILGVGQPHHRWFGLEAYAGISQSAGSEYVGLRGILPYLDARAGVRYLYAIDQYFLAPQPFYTREDIEVDLFGRSHYLAVETELRGMVPIPGGRLIAVATGYLTLGVPEDRYLFEEALKVVINPPVVWRARLGYLATIGWGTESEDQLHFGPAVEVIHNPERGAVTLRLGPLLSVPLTGHLEAMGAVMIAVSSPDQLGLAGADYGTLGLRYRWATGDPSPAFP